jgi:hypothetical protein
MKALWYKFLCLLFGHRWRVIMRSSDEDGNMLHWRGPPKGCFCTCVICGLVVDDLPRRKLNGSSK